MNSRRSVTCMLPVVVLLLAFSLAIGAQGPLLPTLARLDALKLASIEGDVPVRYSKGASRDVASALAARIAECRRLLAAAAGRPSIVLALLDRSDWERVSDRPYGNASSRRRRLAVCHRDPTELERRCADVYGR
jgi:hypothetical protein